MQFTGLHYIYSKVKFSGIAVVRTPDSYQIVITVSFIPAAIAATIDICCLLLKTVLNYLCEADSKKTQYREKSVCSILLVSVKFQVLRISFY